MGLLDAAGRLRYVAGRMWFKILPPLLQKAIHVSPAACGIPPRQMPNQTLVLD
jgi:hypothetical protein